MHLIMREVLWIFWMKMHAWMHELFLPFWYCSFFLKKRMHLWIHKTWFCFIIFEECIYECMWIFWINIHAWMHEFFFLFDFVLFFLEECIYEYVKFCEFSEWKCILECMSSFCLFDIVLFLRMHLWMHETLWIFWMKVHVWIH